MKRVHEGQYRGQTSRRLTARGVGQLAHMIPGQITLVGCFLGVYIGYGSKMQALELIAWPTLCREAVVRTAEPVEAIPIRFDRSESLRRKR